MGMGMNNWEHEGVGVQRKINPSVCAYVCLCVCPLAYLWNRWTDPHEILLLLLFGRVALGAQRPIVVKLSRGRSVGLSVRRSVQCIVEKRRIAPREGVLLGANLGRVIVTNGDFTAYVCDSAATRPSSQISLGKLVIYLLMSKRYC